MKNGKRLTAYLDECEERLRMLRSRDIATLEALNERIERDEAGDMWRALLDDGWTIAEIDEAYYRRTGFRVQR